MQPPAAVLAAFEAAKGFMPAAEGLALYAAAADACQRLALPVLEIGTYCGRSTLLLAEAARQARTLAITVDHHRGSEEQQPGWAYHDPALTDPQTGLIDSLPYFRRNMHVAGLEEHTIAIVGRSAQAAALWRAPLAMVFIDGGHTDAHATADLHGWAPHIAGGGLLAIHDVYADPADGGQAPHRIYQQALNSGSFTDLAEQGSLRILQRTNVA